MDEMVERESLSFFISLKMAPDSFFSPRQSRTPGSSQFNKPVIQAHVTYLSWIYCSGGVVLEGERCGIRRRKVFVPWVRDPICTWSKWVTSPYLSIDQTSVAGPCSMFPLPRKARSPRIQYNHPCLNPS